MKMFSLFARATIGLAGVGLAVACSKTPSSTTAQIIPPSFTPVPVSTANTTFPVPTPAQTPAPNPENDVPRISAQEAKKLVDAGKAVIVDVRGTEAYKTSHIKGALDYPLAKIESKDFSGLPKNKRIIAYCT